MCCCPVAKERFSKFYYYLIINYSYKGLHMVNIVNNI